MQIAFWGVRGSIPAPASTAQYQQALARALALAAGRELSDPQAAAEFVAELPPYLRGVIGGNTACLTLTAGDGRRLIVDAGTGLRALGDQLLSDEPALAQGQGEIHLLLSHTHWDHILGLAFFTPVYVPGNRLHVYGVHAQLQERLADLFHPRHFPVGFRDLGAEVIVHPLKLGAREEVAGFALTSAALDHPGGSFAYRIHETPGAPASVIYATDGEFREIADDPRLDAPEGFYHGATAIVFDAMFTFEEQRRRTDWGHASGLVGVDLCVAARIERLVLFHHDPNLPDETVWRMRDVTEAYARENYPKAALAIDLAREAWSFDV